MPQLRGAAPPPPALAHRPAAAARAASALPLVRGQAFRGAEPEPPEDSVPHWQRNNILVRPAPAPPDTLPDGMRAPFAARADGTRALRVPAPLPPFPTSRDKSSPQREQTNEIWEKYRERRREIKLLINEERRKAAEYYSRPGMRAATVECMRKVRRRRRPAEDVPLRPPLLRNALR